MLQYRPSGRIVPVLQQLNAKPDARKRSPQFVGGIGKQQAVSAEQLFDLFRGLVETCRQTSHLIAPLNFDPRGKVARSDALDGFL